MRRRRQVGAAARRALVGRRALGEGGRGGLLLLGGGRGDDNRGEAGLAVAALEEVVHALAAHDRLEGQRALQPLQLQDKRGGGNSDFFFFVRGRT